MGRGCSYLVFVPWCIRNRYLIVLRRLRMAVIAPIGELPDILLGCSVESPPGCRLSHLSQATVVPAEFQSRCNIDFSIIRVSNCSRLDGLTACTPRSSFLSASVSHLRRST